MNILFWGETASPNGPGNVNRGFHAHLPETFLRPKSANRYLCLAEGTALLLGCKVLVVSGISRQGCLLTALAKLLGKKTVYIMHGSAFRESRWYSNAPLCKQERFLLRRADLLLAVSRMFRDWVREIEPQYAGKTEHLYPGIELPPDMAGNPVPFTVAAAGGDGGIKANGELARAVSQIPGARLTVYGPVKQTCSQGPVRYAGRLSREEFWQELSDTALFVLNSRFESFSLSALEALGLGCSLLISEKAGAAELLDLTEADIIHDPSDIRELERKITYLLQNPNNRRLASSVNWQELTWKAACTRLEAYCAQLTKGGKQ